MSNNDNLQLRYSCFSEPSLVSRSHPCSLNLINVDSKYHMMYFNCNINFI